MERRRVLAGLATAGVSLLAGCNTGGTGDSSDSSGNNTSNGGNDTRTTQSTNSGETPLTSTASASTSTPIATTMIETAQQTAVQTTTTALPATHSTSMPTQELVTSPTPVPTTGGTTESGTPTESVSIDLSNLQTYTNDKYSYSIKYPAGWPKSETQRSSKAGTVAFISGGGFMLVQAIPNTSVSSVDTFVKVFLQSFEESFQKFKSTGKQAVTLPNGNSATVVNVLAQEQTTSLRGKALFTLVDQTIYDVMILVPEQFYTSNVEQRLMDIVTSLTIE